MRRWTAGTDEIPQGIWRAIHDHANERLIWIKGFNDEVAAKLDEPEEVLHPIPNSKILRAHLGLHFALHTDEGRTVRCFIAREVLDDRVPRHPLLDTTEYFKNYAAVFYRVAQQRFNAGPIEHDLIMISNTDVAGEDLPDVRPRKIYTDPRQPAVLEYGAVTMNYPTLGEAVIAWHQLDANTKMVTVMTADDGSIFRGAEIDMLYARY